MEILLGLVGKYGLTVVMAVITVIITQTLKPYVSKKLRPYIPLMLAAATSILTLVLLPSAVTLSIQEMIVAALIEWFKTWAVSVGIYDLVIRALKKEQEDGPDKSE